MKNEEKINEIVTTMKNEAKDLDFFFDGATENAVRFACGWMADWKDKQYKPLIDFVLRQFEDDPECICEKVNGNWCHEHCGETSPNLNANCLMQWLEEMKVKQQK